MEENLRRSSRPVKLKLDKDFVYDEDIVECIVGRNSEVWQPNSPVEHSNADNSNSENSGNESAVQGTITWSELDNLPHYQPLNFNSDYNSTDSNNIKEFVNQSQTRSPSVFFTESASVQFGRNSVNKPSRERRCSSTRNNFLDLQGNYLSVGSSSALSNMSDSEQAHGSKCLRCRDNNKCTDCATAAEGAALPAPGAENQLAQAVMAKLELISQRLLVVENIIVQQDDRLDNIESNNNSVGYSSSGSKKTKKHHSEVGKSKSKLDRVEFERDRALKVSLEKIRNRKKSSKKSESDVESSEDEVNVSSLRKKMPRKQKVALGRNLSSRLSEAGGSWPEEETNTGSGTDACEVRCHSRKKSVKSGATVKKRSVKKMELWPHTIANEEDDTDITSESISLAKFLSCFTVVMNSCRDEDEAAGRSILLQAIATILVDLPWTEARSFHNTIMTKVEQKRINWKSDFISMADDFIIKKLRQLLRPKASSAAADRSFRRGFVRGPSSHPGRGQSSQVSNKPTYIFPCRQWNFGTCSYGSGCNRSHTCWTCSDKGKTGENHKAQTHFTSGATGRQGQGEQRL